MKKTLAIILTMVFAVSCMMVSAFAVSFDFEDGSLDNWTTHGGQGNLSVVDGALFTTGRWNGAFKTAYPVGTLEANNTYTFTLDFYAEPTDFDVDGHMTVTVSIVNGYNGDLNNNLDGEDYCAENFSVPTGEWTTITFEYVPETDATYAIFCVNTINHYAWDCAPEFYIDNLVIDGVAGADYDIPVDEDDTVEEDDSNDADTEPATEPEVDDTVEDAEPDVDDTVVDNEADNSVDADDNTSVDDQSPAEDDSAEVADDVAPVEEEVTDDTPAASTTNTEESGLSTVAIVLVVVAVVTVVVVVIVVVKSKKK